MEGFMKTLDFRFGLKKRNLDLVMIIIDVLLGCQMEHKIA